MALQSSKYFNKKNIITNLKNIYGINKSIAIRLCRQIGYQLTFQLNYMKEEQIEKLLFLIEQKKYNGFVEQDLIRKNQENKNFLFRVNNIRAIRNRIGLPVRGQRTHTNGNTKKKLKFSM